MIRMLAINYNQNYHFYAIYLHISAEYKIFIFLARLIPLIFISKSNDKTQSDTELHFQFTQAKIHIELNMLKQTKII